MFRFLTVAIMAVSLVVLPVGLKAGSDDVLGTWFTGKQDAKITIFKCEDKICGKISWLKNNPDDLDTKNPDPARRNDKILGKVMLWNFDYTGEKWENGFIYDPDSGDTYKCLMWLEGNGVLKVKGFIGFSWIGRSETWTRAE
jgi:uncharacterized protein (DUF2147 family)